MATPGALADLAAQGFRPADLADLADADASDLVLAVHAADEEQARAALAAGADSIFSAARTSDARRTGTGAPHDRAGRGTLPGGERRDHLRPRSVRRAARLITR